MEAAPGRCAPTLMDAMAERGREILAGEPSSAVTVLAGWGSLMWRWWRRTSTRPPRSPPGWPTCRVFVGTINQALGLEREAVVAPTP